MSSRLLFLAVIGLLAAWFLLFRPTVMGGAASYLIVSGTSMEPTLHQGDLALTRKQGSYSVGDIVAFRLPNGQPAEGAMVIHRIVGGTAEEGFVMQGDNKDSRDPWHPRKDDIVGKLWFRAPGGASYLLRLRQPLILGLLAGGLGMLLVLDSGQKRKGPRQEKPPGQRSSAAPPDARRPRPQPSLAGFVVRADNRNAPDSWRPRGQDIMGRVLWLVFALLAVAIVGRRRRD